MRTLLPSASRANAIASWEPIESPSGRACDVRRKRRRVRMASPMCRTADGMLVSTDSLIIVARSGRVVLDGGSAGPLRLEVLEDPFDPVARLDRVVEEER